MSEGLNRQYPPFRFTICIAKLGAATNVIPNETKWNERASSRTKRGILSFIREIPPCSRHDLHDCLEFIPNETQWNERASSRTKRGILSFIQGISPFGRDDGLFGHPERREGSYPLFRRSLPSVEMTVFLVIPNEERDLVLYSGDLSLRSR